MYKLMHCYICDWSPDVESEYDGHERSAYCRLIICERTGNPICTDCSDSAEEALDDFYEDLDEEDG